MSVCCLCAQVEGNPDADLLHDVLGEDRYERRTLAIGSDFVAIPSIGALSDCHVLLCPTSHVRSFAALETSLRSRALGAEGELERRLSTRWPAPIHLFEHGNGHDSAHVSCSVEHAHLHFVASSVDVWPTLSRELSWVEVGDEEELFEHVQAYEYLRYRSPQGIWRVAMTDGAPIPSQLMRRVFADAHGEGQEWDWRVEPELARVRAMWQALAAA